MTYYNKPTLFLGVSTGFAEFWPENLFLPFLSPLSDRPSGMLHGSTHTIQRSFQIHAGSVDTIKAPI
jgi:hypothetical protein